MAPKRGRKKVAQVVKTTKVVEQTVEVSIVGARARAQAQAQAQEQTPIKVSERREEQTTVTTKTKTIPIEEEDEAQDEAQNQVIQETETETETQEPDYRVEEPKFEKIETPPREEARPKKEAQGKKKRGRRMKEVGEGREGYKSYLYKVLKQVHPGMGVSGKAMTVINNMMSDMLERLAMEASKLNMHAKKHTLSSREIQSAVKLVLPGELGKHAIAEGTKAVTCYINYAKN